MTTQNIHWETYKVLPHRNGHFWKCKIEDFGKVEKDLDIYNQKQDEEE